MNDVAKTLRKSFAQRFGVDPVIARAPGRVNLIGDHTDYNGGLVMPVSLAFSTWVAAAPREDGRIVVQSDTFDETIECQLAAVQRPSGTRRALHWADYPLGVAASLIESGCPLRGATLMIEGDVPLGAGLSSSASLEVATAGALLAIMQTTLPAKDIALLCQRAENEFVGMRCGIMDQYVAIFGRAGFALQIDCERLEHRLIPLSFTNKGTRLVICDSQVKHELASSEYNRRRAECEAALAVLRSALPGATTLSSLNTSELAAHAALLEPTLLGRARHVVSENARVRLAADALLAGDVAGVGALMNASHVSLREDFDVSCAELDCLVEAARRCPGTYGARMTGGGFGGCIVSLVREEALSSFEQHVVESYRRAFGREPRLYPGDSGDGLNTMRDMPND